MTQNEKILNHLRRWPLTPKEALNHYGCFRLAARIDELRKAGHPIITHMKKIGTARVAEYTL